MIGWMCAGIVLLLGSIYDVKSFTLPLWLLGLGLCGGIVGNVYLWINEELYWWELLTGLLPGGLSLVLSFLTREQIGYGDGWVLLIVGSMVGGESIWHIWMAGLLASFAVSAVLLILRKASGKKRLPFVPFLLFGYVVTLLGVWGGITGV